MALIRVAGGEGGGVNLLWLSARARRFTSSKEKGRGGPKGASVGQVDGAAAPAGAARLAPNKPATTARRSGALKHISL
jgi:hypothetical protein